MNSTKNPICWILYTTRNTMSFHTTICVYRWMFQRRKNDEGENPLPSCGILRNASFWTCVLHLRSAYEITRVLSTAYPPPFTYCLRYNPLPEYCVPKGVGFTLDCGAEGKWQERHGVGEAACWNPHHVKVAEMRSHALWWNVVAVDMFHSPTFWVVLNWF